MTRFPFDTTTPAVYYNRQGPPMIELHDDSRPYLETTMEQQIKAIERESKYIDMIRTLLNSQVKMMEVVEGLRVRTTAAFDARDKRMAELEDEVGRLRKQLYTPD